MITSVLQGLFSFSSMSLIWMCQLSLLVGGLLFMMTVCVSIQHPQWSIWRDGSWWQCARITGICLGHGSDVDEAVAFANLAAGVVVGKMGTVTASIAELGNMSLSYVSRAPHLSWKRHEIVVETFGLWEKVSIHKRLLWYSSCRAH